VKIIIAMLVGVALIFVFAKARAQQPPPGWVGQPPTQVLPQTERCGWVGRNWVCDSGAGHGTVCTKVGSQWSCRSK